MRLRCNPTSKYIAIALFLLALLWISLWPIASIVTFEKKCRGTFISENALMPGSAQHSVFNDELATIVQMNQAFKDEISSLASTDSINLYLSNFIGCIPHNYSSSLNPQSYTIYCVIKPQRASDRRESIALVAPLKDWSGSVKDNEDNIDVNQLGSVDLVLAIGRYLKDHTMWLSKNIIIIFPSDTFAIRDWLKMYHSSPLATNNIHSALEQERAGIIRGAIIIDSPIDLIQIDSLSILMHGKNGQLPNLDLINTAIQVIPQSLPIVLDKYPMNDGLRKLRKLISETSLDVASPFVGDELITKIRREIMPEMTKTFKQLASLITIERLSFDEYLDRVEMMARFIQRGAFGPTGWHAFFIDNAIDAFSFSFVKKDPRSRTTSVSLHDSNRIQLDKVIDAQAALCSVIEQVIRSISNLEERLHASFYFYILPTPHHLVTIHEYAGALIIYLLPAALYILNTILFWMFKDKESDLKFDACMEFLYAIVSFTICHFIGFCLFLVFTSTKHWLSSQMFIFLLFSSLIFLLATLVLIKRYFLNEVRSRAKKMISEHSVCVEYISKGNERLRRSLKSINLASFFVVNAAIGLWDYSFALLSALVLAPLLVSSQSIHYKSPITSIYLIVYSIAVSFPVVLYIFPDLITERSFWPDTTQLRSQDHLKNVDALESFVESLSRIVVGDYIWKGLLSGVDTMRNGFIEFGLFHFAYFCTILFPIQTIHFFIVFVDIFNL